MAPWAPAVAAWEPAMAGWRAPADACAPDKACWREEKKGVQEVEEDRIYLIRPWGLVGEEE